MMEDHFVNFFQFLSSLSLGKVSSYSRMSVKNPVKSLDTDRRSSCAVELEKWEMMTLKSEVANARFRLVAIPRMQRQPLSVHSTKSE